MTEQARITVPKWPFFLGDAILLGLAWFVFSQSKLPLDAFALGAICACTVLGAILAIVPFVLEYRIILKQAEASALTSVVDQVQNLEAIAIQIGQATGQWQTVQEHSSKTVAAAKEIGDAMTVEAKAFAEFMQKANDTEKSTLRLEVDKLRRSETEWLQIVVRMLDHTYALHTAAVRSGKAGVIEQLTQFQNALRDVARRVGLVPFAATPGEAFDATRHQTADDQKPADGATVGETAATGYTFRGQLIRPALVVLAGPPEAPAAMTPASANSTAAPEAPPQEPTLF
jgi:molecular chaperone GrpE (heat shock protein)